jgi:hypothetical protein
VLRDPLRSLPAINHHCRIVKEKRGIERMNRMITLAVAAAVALPAAGVLACGIGSGASAAVESTGSDDMIVTGTVSATWRTELASIEAAVRRTLPEIEAVSDPEE